MKWVFSLFAACIAYSIVRYVAFAPKNLDNLPVFIVNKGVAMAAALCLTIGFFQLYRRDRSPSATLPSTWFRAGVFGAIWHIPMSLAITRPAYFKEFFAPISGGTDTVGRLSFAGELVFLFGGLSAAMVFLLLRPTWSPVQRWALSIGAMAALLAHTLALGNCRGLNINASHAYLPPMWLLCVIGVAVGLIILLRGRPADRDRSAPNSPPSDQP